MQNSYFLPDNVSAHIHRPACPKCRAFMILARIVPARVGFDFHTIECPQCDHVHEVLVATEAFGRTFYATGIGGSVMEQETQNLPDSRVWDNRATEVIAEARKMPLGEASCLSSDHLAPCAKSQPCWHASPQVHRALTSGRSNAPRAITCISARASLSIR